MTDDETDEVEKTYSPEGPGMEPDEREESSMVEYGIEDKPPLGESILLGFQHYLTMIGATVAIPLALAGPRAAGGMGMPDAQTAQLIATFFVVSGIATLAQTTIGNRYPIVQGGTFSMLAPAFAIIGVLGQQGAGWETMILELQGAVIVAGVVEFFLGYLGVFGWLKKYMGPIVIAPVIALIGLALFNTGQITTPTQNWWLLGVTLVSIIAFSQYLDQYHRVFRLYPVLLGLGSAWLLALVLSQTGMYVEGSVGYVSLEAVRNADAFRAVTPLQWGTPKFTSSFIIGMIAGMLASAIESFGDYHAVARMAGKGAPSSQRVNHGIGMEGIGNTFAGIMGTGNGSTSYTENVGAIGITGVASRYVVQIGAIVMLVVGFIGPVGALFTTIPNPIVGGLFIAMFGQIAAVGISQLKYIDMDANRNIYIVGLSLFLGLAIPNYMGQLSADAMSAGLGNAWIIGDVLTAVGVSDSVGQIVFVIGTTGMAVGGIIAFVLDNTIPGTREERGLDEWEAMTEGDEEFVSIFERLGGSDETSGSAD